MGALTPERSRTMITRKQAVVAMYGRALNLVDLIEEGRNAIYSILQDVPYSSQIGELILTVDQLAKDANGELSNTLLQLQEVVPDAEVHPLTGDVLDKTE